jgi:regulator of replication initiation timing
LSKSPKSFHQFVVESCERVSRVFDEEKKKENNISNITEERTIIEDGVRMILIETARLNVQRDELERTLKEEIFFSSEAKEEEGDEGKNLLTRTSDALVDGVYPFVKGVQNILEEIEEDEGRVDVSGGTSRGIKRLESCEVRVDAVVAEKNSSEYRTRLENRWHFAEEDSDGLKRRSELKFACSEEEGEMLSNALKEALRAAENARL